MASKKNIIVLYVYNFKMYDMGQRKEFVPTTRQQLEIIKIWYDDYFNSIVDKNDEKILIISVTENNELKVIIETEFYHRDYEHLYGKDGIYNKFVHLGDQDYPFYLNKELFLTKNILKRGTSPSYYDEEEQQEIEELLDNTYELFTPSFTLNFYTSKK